MCLPFFVSSSGSAPNDDGHSAPLSFERSSLSSLVATSVGGHPHPLTEHEMDSILGSFAVGSRVKVLELLYHEALRGRPSGPCTSLIVCDKKTGGPTLGSSGNRSPATSRSRSDKAFHDASKLRRRGASVVSDKVARPLGFILVRRSDLKQHGLFERPDRLVRAAARVLNSRGKTTTAASRIILNSWKRFGMNGVSAALSYRTYPSSIYAESRLCGIREIM